MDERDGQGGMPPELEDWDDLIDEGLAGGEGGAEERGDAEADRWAEGLAALEASVRGHLEELAGQSPPAPSDLVPIGVLMRDLLKPADPESSLPRA